MEKSQSEVTNKIRSAIKQKLAEISDFVDDELPEYIMILVANQRSKSQIEKDLSLFLRKDTVKFTNWLWDLLNNLKVESKSDQTSVPKTDTDDPKKEVETDEDAVVLDFDPDEREIDFLSHDDTNDSVLSKSSPQPSSCQDSDVKKEVFEPKSSQNYKPVEKSKSEVIPPVKTQKKSQGVSSKEPISSAVIPVKRKFADSEDEYDPSKPEYEKPSPKSKVRKYNGPAALQANKLLLKAVDDATKSILAGKNVDEYYKPTPIKVLASKINYNTMPTYTEEKLQTKKSFLKLLHETEPEVDDFSVPELDLSGFPQDVIMEDVTDYPIAMHRNRTICLNPNLSFNDSIDFDESEFIPESNSSYSFQAVEHVRPKSPHFIVTLDGVSRTSFKNRFGENSVDSMEEEEEEEEIVDRNELLSNKIVALPEKKQKLNERCKYWPACKNSENCPYHHPTVPCKCFPACKFGDKCLYIHPNCKFDALCSRKDCPYTHASKRKLPLIAVPVKMIPIKNRRAKVVCKFYPKCTSKNCPFIHPKLCRYGTECRLPSCLYGHFPVPSRSQLKWQAAI